MKKKRLKERSKDNYKEGSYPWYIYYSAQMMLHLKNKEISQKIRAMRKVGKTHSSFSKIKIIN